MSVVLVTGGAGFIGSNIAEALLARGDRAVVLDDLSTGRRENIDPLMGRETFRFVEGTILDAALVTSLIREEGITHINHQAARPSVSKSLEDPALSMEINAVGTTAILKAAADEGVRRVVFASSSSVYGDTPELPKRESMPLRPKSPYAVSKAAKEMMATAFSQLYGTTIVGLRYFNVYGRKQDPTSQYAAVIPRFISCALKGRPLPVEGDGGQTRDFTYIDDVVAANLNALFREDVPSGFYNIAYGERTSVLDLARSILEATNSESHLAHGPPRPGDVRDSLADIAPARRHLGYAPRFDIRQGLEETVAWYRANVPAPT